MLACAAAAALFPTRAAVPNWAVRTGNDSI